MRVLVVDQDSASNEAIARSLRDLFTVDAVTNKADCLDLLRSNTFEVIVAAERLEDGSGLELLGQIAKKWPSVLRIFAADRQRLALLKGRLGPFELFQTLIYPIDPDRLIATLNLAEAAQDAHADTTNIEHFVLGGEPPPERMEEVEELSESGEFPAPQPLPRAASAGHSPEGSNTVRGGSRAAPPLRARSSPGPRTKGAAGSAVPRLASGVSATRGPAASTAPAPGSRPLRHRARGGSNRAPPARFPPLERIPPVEPPQNSRASSSSTDSFAEAAALARAARSNYESSPENLDTRRLGIRIGAAAAAVVAIVFIGFKLFGSSTSEPPRAAPHPVTQAPQYPPEVTELVARVESALKADDYKQARVDVDKLRQISPSHPRLAFFEGLLTQRSSASKGSSSISVLARGAAKRRVESSTRVTARTNPSPTKGTPSLAPETPPGTMRSATLPAVTESSGSATPAAAVPAASPGATPTQASEPSQPSAAPALAPAASPQLAPASAAPTQASMGSAQPDAASTRASSSAAPTPTLSSGEPPPVIREAKLIRRVAPDYPSAAKRDGITGWVDLEVTVSPQGAVNDASIVRASPSDIFDKSALTAVRKWKYDPRFVDGLASEAHLKVHLEFGPDK